MDYYINSAKLHINFNNKKNINRSNGNYTSKTTETSSSYLFQEGTAEVQSGFSSALNDIHEKYNRIAFDTWSYIFRIIIGDIHRF